MVTQPKSIAMVVVVLPDAWPGSSTPTPSIVISASVVSGEISEMAPTVVVLPTPKPPATMILTGTGAVVRCWPSGTRAVPTTRFSGYGSKSTDHSHDGLGVGEVVAQHVNVKVSGGPQVADQDPGDAEVHPEPGGDLGHRQRLAAEAHDRPFLGRQTRGQRARLGADLGLQPDVRVGAADPAGGDEERSQRAGLLAGWGPGQGRGWCRSVPPAGCRVAQERPDTRRRRVL